MIMSENHYVEKRLAGKRLYDTKAVNRKFPAGSWVLRYYPPAAQHKLDFPWIGPNQVVRQATGHTVGIQRDPERPIVFVHDLKLARGRMTSNGVLTFLLLNNCVLVRWLSDRALMSVMLRQHRPSMCPAGRTCRVIIRVIQPLVS